MISQCFESYWGNHEFLLTIESGSFHAMQSYCLAENATLARIQNENEFGLAQVFIEEQGYQDKLIFIGLINNNHGLSINAESPDNFEFVDGFGGNKDFFAKYGSLPWSYNTPKIVSNETKEECVEWSTYREAHEQINPNSWNNIDCLSRMSNYGLCRRPCTTQSENLFAEDEPKKPKIEFSASIVVLCIVSITSIVLFIIYSACVKETGKEDNPSNGNTQSQPANSKTSKSSSKGGFLVGLLVASGFFALFSYLQMRKYSKQLKHMNHIAKKNVHNKRNNDF